MKGGKTSCRNENDHIRLSRGGDSRELEAFYDVLEQIHKYYKREPTCWLKKTYAKVLLTQC